MSLKESNNTQNRPLWPSLIRDEESVIPYITDQNDPAIAQMPYGMANVGFSGCAAIASYNALWGMGIPVSFDNVVDWYNDHARDLYLYGLAGTSPDTVAEFFKEGEFGEVKFYVIVTSDVAKINKYSSIADGCIMYYKFPKKYDLGLFSVDAYGAHFVAYQRVGDKYVGYNTPYPNGIKEFDSIFNYCASGNRYDLECIFIFKKV